MNDTRSPVVVFRERLLSRREEIAAALEGQGVSPDRMIRAVVTALQTTPKLGEVTFVSLWAAALKACRDGLLPDGREGALVPYKGEAVWIPMYRGLINRFERSGQYKWIHAGFHRTRDIWRIWIDEQGQHFLHEPSAGDDSSKVIETYACATTTNGAFFISVVSEGEMKRIRETSRAQREDSPWNKWEEQMKLKTALKRLCKILPMPAPLVEMMEREDENGDGAAEPGPALPRRPRGAQAALEQFASDDGKSAASEGTAVRDPGTQYIETAYERGKDAKAHGQTRDDIPEEYTARGRGKEAVFWRKGFDGDPYP
jgi:recombination protein RecT